MLERIRSFIQIPSNSVNKLKRISVIHLGLCFRALLTAFHLKMAVELQMTIEYINYTIYIFSSSYNLTLKASHVALVYPVWGSQVQEVTLLLCKQHCEK